MTRFVIRKSDIVHNYNELAKLTHAIVIPTLKANCYGLGARTVMELLQAECGVSLFALSSIEEALELCDKGADLLLLSCYRDKDTIRTIVDNNIICAVDSLAQARLISQYAMEQGVRARVHIKIDTGFGRFGFMPGNIADIKAVYSLDGIKAEGIFSHFSNAFCPNPSDIDRQFELFMDVIRLLEDEGINVGIRHIANSCAALRDRKYCLDAVRIGSALTGRLPMKTDVHLIRVGQFETHIADIRTLKKGSNIGYGNVFKLKRNTRVAVLCVGSAHGVLIKKDYDTYRFVDILRYGFNIFKMLFSDSRLRIKINGMTVRSVGRIALTHTMADITDVNCECGDTAIIDISPLFVSDRVEREYI